MISLAVIAALCVVVVGAVVLWSNPARWVNRFVLSASIVIAAWLVCLHFAYRGGGLIWLRITTSVGTLIPLQFWLVKEAILRGGDSQQSFRTVRATAWVAMTALLAILPLTAYFIPLESTAKHPLYGHGYYIYIAGVLLLYITVGYSGFRRLRDLDGDRRTTLQVWLGGGCAAAITILALMGVGAIFHDPRYVRLQPLVALLYYSATAYAISTYRIFNARELLLASVAKLSLILLVALVAFGADWAFASVLPEGLSWILTTACALGVASVANAWLGRMFQYYPRATAARQETLEIAGRDTREDRLIVAFERVLRKWAHTERVGIFAIQRPEFAGATDRDGRLAALAVLAPLRWATPERLIRERSDASRSFLSQYVRIHELGAVACVEGPSAFVMVELGRPASRRAYTYPQMTELLEMLAIMASAVGNAHLSAKVQHAEQLATVGLLGASVAHEIRNPLVTIKTFVQLLPAQHQNPAFREKFFRLIADEVQRIDQLTEQLLDLASPRAYSATLLEIHPVVGATISLVATKAAHRSIELITDLAANPDRVYTDAAAAKQVLLNLCFNAIQAIDESPSRRREVRVATRNAANRLDVLVSDTGPGIAPEMLPRLFQPFQTTKSTGFGLGLAICSDILSNLGATISVDPPVPGQGATFRVSFPCQPS